MVRLSVVLPNGKVFLVLRQSTKQRPSDQRCVRLSHARKYTEETLRKLYLIGEIADVYSGADGLGEKFVFVSLDVSAFACSSMDGFLKIFKRRYHLSHVQSFGTPPFLACFLNSETALHEDSELKVVLKHFRENPPTINIHAFTQ
jgi:hypothetical protein